MGRFDAVDEVEEKDGFFDAAPFLYVVEFQSAEEISTHTYDVANCYRWKVLATDDPMCPPGTGKVMIDGRVKYNKRAYWAERMMQYERELAVTKGQPARTKGDEFAPLFDTNWEEYAGCVLQIATTPSEKVNQKTGKPYVNTRVSRLSAAGQALLDGDAGTPSDGNMPAPASRKRFGG